MVRRDYEGASENFYEWSIFFISYLDCGNGFMNIHDMLKNQPFKYIYIYIYSLSYSNEMIWLKFTVAMAKISCHK